MTERLHWNPGRGYFGDLPRCINTGIGLSISVFCAQGKKCVQAVNACVLSERGWNGFQGSRKGFHGKAFSARLLLGSDFDSQ